MSEFDKKKKVVAPGKTIPGFNPVVGNNVSSMSLNIVSKRTFKEAQAQKKKKKIQDQIVDSSSKKSFKTDADITGNKSFTERKLVKWKGTSDDSDFLTSLEDLSVSAKPFDQFEINKQKFNIDSNYDETFYNLKIDKGSENYSANLKKAEELERMMLSDSSMNRKSGNQHLDEERGIVSLKEDDDDESKYSGVIPEDFSHKKTIDVFKTPSPVFKKSIDGSALLKSIQKPNQSGSPLLENSIGNPSATPSPLSLFKKGNTTRTNRTNEKLIISRVHLKNKDQTVKELKQFSKEFTIPKSLIKTTSTTKIDKCDSIEEIPAKIKFKFFDPELNPRRKSKASSENKVSNNFNYFKNLESQNFIPKSFITPPIFKTSSTKKYKEVLASSKFVSRKKLHEFSSVYPPPQQQQQFFGNMPPASIQSKPGSFSMPMQSLQPQMVSFPMFIPPQSESNMNENNNSRSTSFNMGLPPNYLIPPQQQLSSAGGYYIPMPIMMGAPQSAHDASYNYNNKYNTGYKENTRKLTSSVKKTKKQDFIKRK
ncbi:hypothetical protein QEN19_002648 [Hanseniaspora menglaensis]